MQWDLTFRTLERLAELRAGITTALADKKIFTSSVAAKLESCKLDFVQIELFVIKTKQQRSCAQIAL